MRRLLLCIALVACGDDSAATKDGGTGSGDGGDGGGDVDAMIDADPNVRGTVTVHLVDRRGEPLAGMHAVFVDTDGTVSDVVSDASGNASASVYPNATVTAIRERTTTPPAYQLTTVLALNPGDTITLISSPGSVSSAEDTFNQGLIPLPAHFLGGTSKQGSTGTYTTLTPHGLAVGDSVVVDDVTVPAYNGSWTVSGVPSSTTFTVNLGSGGQPDGVGGTAAKAERFTVSYPANAGANSYDIYSPCGVTESVSTSQVILLRPGCSSPTMDLVVAAKNNGVVVGWVQQAGVAFTANGNVAIAGGWQTPSQITASYTNTTATVSDIAVRRFVPYNREPATGATGTVAGGAATLMINGASTPARAVMQTALTCESGDPACVSDTAQQNITQVVDGTQTSYSLDVGANLLPWVEATWLPASTTMEVTLTGTGNYDMFHGALRYTRGQVTQVIYTWRIFGPVAGTFQFPTLPSTVPGDPTIRVNDPQASYVVGLCESDAINGYRDAIDNVYEAYNTCLSSTGPSVVRLGGTLDRISTSK